MGIYFACGTIRTEAHVIIDDEHSTPQMKQQANAILWIANYIETLYDETARKEATSGGDSETS